MARRMRGRGSIDGARKRSRDNFDGYMRQAGEEKCRKTEGSKEQGRRMCRGKERERERRKTD